jgi:hypothetical protein
MMKITHFRVVTAFITGFLACHSHAGLLNISKLTLPKDTWGPDYIYRLSQREAEILNQSCIDDNQGSSSSANSSGFITVKHLPNGQDAGLIRKSFAYLLLMITN